MKWIDHLAQHTPGMLRAWNEHQAEWPDGPLFVSACGEFAHALIADLPGLTDATLRAVFNEVERICVEDGEEARTAVCTGFLEALSNCDSNGNFDMTPIAPYLGLESRAYIKAWDTFTGVKTRGVWEG